jgi:hypothetical protein
MKTRLLVIKVAEVLIPILVILVSAIFVVIGGVELAILFTIVLGIVSLLLSIREYSIRLCFKKAELFYLNNKIKLSRSTRYSNLFISVLSMGYISYVLITVGIWYVAVLSFSTLLLLYFNIGRELIVLKKDGLEGLDLFRKTKIPIKTIKDLRKEDDGVLKFNYYEEEKTLVVTDKDTDKLIEILSKNTEQ